MGTLTGGNKRERKKAYQQKISNQLRFLTRNGKPLFPKETSDEMAKKRGLSKRLSLFLELADYYMTSLSDIVF